MMVLMAHPSHDPAAESPPAETVVEFGPQPDEPRTERRRFSLGEFAAGLAADRRAVPLAATVGAVAVFASLISEWQVTQVDSDQFAGGTPAGGSRPLPAGVTDLGALGGAYLVGLFVLTGAIVLLLYGPLPVRRYARLIGLSTGGVLIAMLAALTASLGDTSRTVLAVVAVQFEEDQIQIAYGRGLWCAFFGVAAVLLASYLAGRHEPSVVVADQEEPEAVEAAPVVWSWRRPQDTTDEGPPDPPFGLTVTSAKPFTSRPDDRDKPN